MRSLRAGAAGCALLVLAGCGSSPEKSTPSPKSSKPSKSANVAASPSTNAGNPSTPAGWGMPVDVPGWRLAVADQNGINQEKSGATRCQATFAQNKGARKLAAQGLTPAASVRAYREQIGREVKGMHAHPGIPMSFAMNMSGQGPKKKFVTGGWSYQGSDGVAWTNAIGAQWIGDIELIAIVACPTPTWKADQPTVRRLLHRTTISMG